MNYKEYMNGPGGPKKRTINTMSDQDVNPENPEQQNTPAPEPQPEEQPEVLGSNAVWRPWEASGRRHI